MNAFVFTKSQDDFYREVCDYLCMAGVNLIPNWGSTYAKQPNKFTVVIGGDGTVLAAAREGVRNPVLVINTGHLGFLTSSTQQEYKSAIDKFLAGKYTVTVRNMLDIAVGETKFTALNDVVLKNNLSKLSQMAVYLVKGKAEELVSYYRADGLIISTPTGSTAYNLSAGGSVVHPACQTLLVTPICPQGLTHRPLVLPATDPIRVRPLDNELSITIDGQIVHPITQDHVTVKFNSHKIEIVDPDASYFEILRKKLSWGVKPV